MEKKNDKGALHLALGFMERMRKDHVSAYAAQAAYFLIMSFIPFVLFLTAIVQYTPLTYREVRQAIMSVVPENLQGFVLNIVAEVFSKSAAVLPLSALVALWSSGKGMQALINGLNTIYHVKETRNWLVNRIYSMFYMFLFVLADRQSFASGYGKQDPCSDFRICSVSGKCDRQDSGGKNLSGLCDAVFCFSGAVPVSAKQKGIPEKPGSGSFSDSCGMVCVFVSVFSVFYIFSGFQYHVRKPFHFDPGYGMAVFLYEPSFVRSRDQRIL